LPGWKSTELNILVVLVFNKLESLTIFANIGVVEGSAFLFSGLASTNYEVGKDGLFKSFK